jgi:hypothetical protein
MDDSLPTLYETMVEEPLSTLEEEQQQQQQQPFPWRPQSSSPDNIIRTASPMGRRYLKPVNGIQIKGFARSGGYSNGEGYYIQGHYKSNRLF